MITHGSLIGGVKPFAPVPASVEPPAIQRSVESGPQVSAFKPTQPPPVVQQAALTVAQPLNPTQLINNNWLSIQNLLVGMNITPTGARPNSNPFVDRINEAASSDTDPETGEARDRNKGAHTRVVPTLPSRYQLDEDPFDDQRLDIRF